MDSVHLKCRSGFAGAARGQHTQTLKSPFLTYLMNVIIVGAGEVGFHIADRLSKEGHEVTVIERSREKEQFLKAKLCCSLCASATSSTWAE